MEDNKKENVIDEDFKDVKKAEKKGVLSTILSIILWIVLLAWMAVVLIDFFHVRNDEDPQFCFWNKKTTEYQDGTIKECTGAGYKVIKYDRESYKAVEFGSDISYVRVLTQAEEKLARPIPVPTEEVEGSFFMTVNKNASAAASRAEAGASRIMYAGLKSIFSIGVMIAFIAFVVTLVIFIINLNYEAIHINK